MKKMTQKVTQIRQLWFNLAALAHKITAIIWNHKQTVGDAMAITVDRTLKARSSQVKYRYEVHAH